MEDKNPIGHRVRAGNGRDVDSGAESESSGQTKAKTRTHAANVTL